MKEEKQTGGMLEPRTTYRNVKPAARKCGCTPEHLSYVLHGRRPCSQTLARKLTQLGFALPKTVKMAAAKTVSKAAP